MSKTLYDKIYDAHVISSRGEEAALLYIDLHLIHEVTTPQAFEGLRRAGRKVRRPEATLGVLDHNVPTTSRDKPITEPMSRHQVDALTKNCADFGVELLDMHDIRQGIVHVVGPEQGLTLPGSTVVCGDSHTATHGAFGALAFGIGTSEVEHVLATQTLVSKRLKNLRVTVTGELGAGVTAKDVALAVIGELTAAGGQGSVIEFAGTVIEAFSMEGRMTLCNMAIEAGARAGLIAPDETTFAYLADKPRAPKGEAWDAALEAWRKLKSDVDAKFDREVTIDGASIAPQVTWGTSPDQVSAITGYIPSPDKMNDAASGDGARRALVYMGIAPEAKLTDIVFDRIFIGSCTNARIEDFREAAAILKGRHIATRIKQALAVPGSGLVKAQAEREGLDKIYIDAGFEWREPGCSMCLAMNPDKTPPGERCASTSNRNFVGRQGPGARTHLMSPAMAAAAAVTGRLTDVRELME